MKTGASGTARGATRRARRAVSRSCRGGSRGSRAPRRRCRACRAAACRLFVRGVTYRDPRVDERARVAPEPDAISITGAGEPVIAGVARSGVPQADGLGVEALTWARFPLFSSSAAITRGARLRGIVRTQGHRALVWPHDQRAGELEHIGVRLPALSFRPTITMRCATSASAKRPRSWRSATTTASTFKSRSKRATSTEGSHRVRQFNRTLARKIEQNLPNCSVLSLASHSAATSPRRPSTRCFARCSFPISTACCPRSRALRRRFGIAGLTLAQAQRRLPCASWR